jgi:Fur family transcriptional regulator, ferric uptake regulator
MSTALHRQSITKLIQEAKGPLSADEVRQELGHRSIGQATVYRLLKQGVTEGEFLEVAFPEGPRRFEMAGLNHHHHFLCQECDRAFDIKGCPKQVPKLAPENFQVEDHDILLRGRCPDCSRKAG